MEGAEIAEVIVAIGTCLVLGYGVRLVLADHLFSAALLVFILQDNAQIYAQLYPMQFQSEDRTQRQRARRPVGAPRHPGAADIVPSDPEQREPTSVRGRSLSPQVR